MADRKRPSYGPSRGSLVLFAVLSAVIACAAGYCRPALVAYADRLASDALAVVRGRSTPPKDVAIVAVDQKSIDEYGPWPWDGATLGRLIEALRPASVVAVDFDLPGPSLPDDRPVLAEAVAKAGNVVLGYKFTDIPSDTSGDAAGDSSGVPEEPEGAALIERSRAGLVSFSEDVADMSLTALPLRVFSGLSAPDALSCEGAAGFGFTNTAPRADGVHDAVTLLYGFRADVYPSLALEAMRKHLGGEVVIYAVPEGVHSVRVRDVTVPVDPAAGMRLSFYGPTGAFTTYSASDVLAGAVPEEALREKLVFVGLVSVEGAGVRTTPVDRNMPEVELQATAAADMLSGRFLADDPRFESYALVMVFVLPVLFALAVSFTRPWYWGPVVFAALAGAYLAACYYVFVAMNITAHVVLPAASLTVAFVSGSLYRAVSSASRKGRHKVVLSARCSPGVVDELMRAPGSLGRDAERREVTALSTGIRGLGGLAGNAEVSPEVLTSVLDEYRARAKQAVFDCRGMIGAVTGGLMTALFNAPLDDSVHAHGACEAALRMAAALDVHAFAWEAQGTPTVDFSAGIDTGPSVIELKVNIEDTGSSGFDCTIIGPPMDLSGALMRLNALYGTKVIVSEATREAASEGFAFRELDLIRIAEVPEPVAVFELVGRAEEASNAGVYKKYSKALSHYRTGAFKEAASVFAELAKKHGDAPSRLFKERCASLALNPPEKWDGVYAGVEPI